MDILLIGGTGTIGSVVNERLQTDHNVILAGRSSGDVSVNITDPNSINTLFEKIGPVDAVIVTAGSAPVKPLEDTTNEDVLEGVKSKMMGQINVALTAVNFLNEGGSITLTSGILSRDPIPGGTVLSTVNGAIDGFVTGAYGEFLQKGFRINAVSPALVEDSADALGEFFPGHTPAKMNHVASGYIKSVQTLVTGEIITIS